MHRTPFLTGNQQCTDLRFTDVSSKKVMENNGWTFKDIGRVFVRSGIRDEECGSDSWYGWKSPGSNVGGSVSVTFVGSGSGTLTYGNCWGQDMVDVYFNDSKIASASVNELKKEVRFEFQERTTLEIRTEGKGIVKIDSLAISCSGKRFNYL